MANQNPLFELGQQSMLRIIRSARSRLGREHSVDDEQARNSTYSQQGMDRPAKRASTARSSAFGGSGRNRLMRSRSSLDSGCSGQGNSENAAPEKPQNPPAALGGGVLGDITNSAPFPPAGPSDASAKAFLVMASQNELGPPPPVAPAVPALAKSPSDCLESDARHANDPQYVMEYMSDIYQVLHREEARHSVEPGYMERQAHVNSKMRAILVDWLVSVQQKYKLRAETLFLAISLIDRYLELKATARRYLQLVGVTAMLIAAKFEEMYPPQISDFVYVTDKAYAKDDIIKMEVTMLAALDFKVCRPTPMCFLDRYQSVNGCTEAHRDLAQYLLELTLLDYNMIKYSPSRLAAASILLSNKLLRRQPAWKAAAVKQTRFTEQMLKECAKEMCQLLEKAEHSPLQAVRKKFSQLKYHSVAKINFQAAPTSSTHTTQIEEAVNQVRSAARRNSVGGPSAPRRSIGGQPPEVAALSVRQSYSPGPVPMDTIATLN